MERFAKGLMYAVLAFFVLLLLFMGVITVTAPSAEDTRGGERPVPVERGQRDTGEAEANRSQSRSPEEEAAQRLIRNHRGRLEAIDGRCVEGIDQLAQMAVRGPQLLRRDGGPDMTPADFLREMDDATRGLSGFDCTQLFAALIALLVRTG